MANEENEERMGKVFKDDLPSEGVQIIGVGHFKPGEDVLVRESVATTLLAKGFSIREEE